MESDKFFDALSHKMRRHIVKVLSLNTTMSYTELMSALRITEIGKLSFHLKMMGILLSQNEEKRYLLSPLGRKASLIISDIESTPHLSSELTRSTIARLPRRAVAYIVGSLLVFLSTF
jgi:hypothetical protein